MSTPLPSCSTRQAITALQRAGFERCKSHGHYILRGHGRTVALPRGDLHYRTLRLVIKQSGLSVDEFIELLRK